MGFPGGSDGNVSAYNVGHRSLVPGLGRSSGEGNGNPIQYSFLENSMDGEAQSIGVAKSHTQLGNFTFSFTSLIHIYINISFHTHFISYTHTHTHTHTETQVCSVALSCLTLWSFGLWPTRLLCPWDFPGKNTGMVAVSSSRGSFPPSDRTSISYLSRQILFHRAPWENPQTHTHTLFGEE